MSVSKHASHAVSKVITQGDEFLKDHPLFGDDKELPKTAQALKDLAKQVNDGLITVAVADVKARKAVSEELESFPADKRERLVRHAAEVRFEELLNS